MKSPLLFRWLNPLNTNPYKIETVQPLYLVINIDSWPFVNYYKRIKKKVEIYCSLKKGVSSSDPI